MVDLKLKQNCCGCGACMQICPKNAIEMLEDEKGFKYPSIDYGICIKCGLCESVCGFIDDYSNNGDVPKVYAVKNNNENVRKTSTSGGAFTAFSDYVLENGGVVYGTNYDDSIKICHERATTKEHRDKFKGSKYVQSDIGNTYKRAKEDLENGLLVLYTGTPCQISCLKKYLRKDYENLITIDLVCHGVPSPKLWREFLDIIEKRAKDKVIYAEFRNNETSWTNPKPKMHYDHRKNSVFGEECFSELYYTNYMLRDACYNCKFTNFSRPGDITLGDFWGINKALPDFNDNKGISLVLLNSEKAVSIFEKIKENITYGESTKEACRQGQMTCPVSRKEKTDEFWEDYLKNGMKYVLHKYTNFTKTKFFFFKLRRRTRILLKKLR